MKRSMIFAICVMAVAVLATSCTDPFWDGKFSSSVYFVNNTEGDIVAEYENIELDTTYSLVIPPTSTQYTSEIEICLGEFQANKKDKWPPEEYVSERMSHLTIYRMVGDTKQYLPSSCYDESSDFKLGADYEFDIHYVKYGLVISEEMFYEDDI